MRDGQIRTAGGVLNVRSGASTGYRNVGLAGPYATVPIECQAVGQYISGYVRATNLWDRVGPGGPVSAGRGRLPPPVGWCLRSGMMGR